MAAGRAAAPAQPPAAAAGSGQQRRVRWMASAMASDARSAPAAGCASSRHAATAASAVTGDARCRCSRRAAVLAGGASSLCSALHDAGGPSLPLQGWAAAAAVPAVAAAPPGALLRNPRHDSTLRAGCRPTWDSMGPLFTASGSHRRWRATWAPLGNRGLLSTTQRRLGMARRVPSAPLRPAGVAAPPAWRAGGAVAPHA